VLISSTAYDHDEEVSSYIDTNYVRE